VTRAAWMGQDRKSSRCRKLDPVGTAKMPAGNVTPNWTRAIRGSGCGGEVIVAEIREPGQVVSKSRRSR